VAYLISLPTLEMLMDVAWPAPERHDTGEWVLRAADGVTQRANSVWPRAEAEDPDAAAREAAAWYRKRRLPVIYQIFSNGLTASLDGLLDRQGFSRQSETLVMTMAGPCEGDNRAVPPGVEITDQPSSEWARLWWSVDGRGGQDHLATALTIATGCPSLYALVRDDDGAPAAVGRLAMADGYGGLYCMATRPNARRRGFGQAVLDALLLAGSSQGIGRYWLLVTASNHGAQAMYCKAGFAEAGRYVYRQAPLRRAGSG
jgi:GNAT superfamily N-acetyltransferase